MQASNEYSIQEAKKPPRAKTAKRPQNLIDTKVQLNKSKNFMIKYGKLVTTKKY